jgi:cellobiose-specific phosphotransferase system component IIA
MNEKLTSKSVHNIACALFCVTLMSAGAPVFAASSNGKDTTKTPSHTPATLAKEDSVKSAASQEMEKRRQSLVKEAVAANNEIVSAISALQNKDTKKAYSLLEKADGQLSVVMARDPHMQLAPIDVSVSINDLETTPKMVKKTIKNVKSALDKGEVQVARALLMPLASEMHIDTAYLPLEVYPTAIQQASLLIEESKPKQAEATLTDTLDSIVTKEDIIPLPVIKAEGDVLDAEKLFKQDKTKNKKEVMALLKSADDHLTNASALGYGKYKNIRDEISSVQSKVEGGTDKHNLFDRAEHFFHDVIHGKMG